MSSVRPVAGPGVPRTAGARAGGGCPGLSRRAQAVPVVRR